MFAAVSSFIKKIREPKPNDPFAVLPKNCCENILQFLSGAELLECSKVNKRWNSVIGKSESFEKKVRLKVSEIFGGALGSFTIHDVNFIITNGRRYKHIKLFITRKLTSHHLLLLASFKWISVRFYYHAFRTEIEMTNFFGIIEANVEELELRDIRCIFSRKDNILAPNMIFPKLRTLRLADCNTYIYSQIFQNVKTIQMLHLETKIFSAVDYKDWEFIERVKAFQTILRNNQNLKVLGFYLHQTDFDNLFIDDKFLCGFKFQLEALKFKKFRKQPEPKSNTIQMENLQKFLSMHNKTLKYLELNEWLGNDVLETVINTMDNLKTLAICELETYGTHDDSIANMNFFKNESIESVSLHAGYSKFNELQRILVGQFPNLKALRIGTVNQPILKVLVEKAHKLEHLETDFFTAFFPPDRSALRHLRSMRIHIDYARHFKDILRDFSYYSNFETVFLNAAKTVDIFHKAHGIF
ncbi:CLUMA_CG016818, isoform A [Clunio marinus]|uniref:CLUMA_CG016818, isoform A n=1 Tax=Clunio marinus TaxID=568069 RepID=A0A1J1IX78_9DIPT|nr:CLUMA_CG016818, isoform A [Clunio marinus]